MSINDRIEKIKPYFALFNISAEEDAIYVVVRFPEGWTVPDRTALKSSYNVEVAAIDGGLFFATEIKNGAECVFDAIDYVVDFNKSVEERKALLTIKLNELKKLFSTESVERLKTLTFTFEDIKKPKTSRKKKEAEVVAEKVSEPVVPDKVEPQEESESSLMSLAKNLTEEK